MTNISSHRVKDNWRSKLFKRSSIVIVFPPLWLKDYDDQAHVRFQLIEEAGVAF